MKLLIVESPGKVKKIQAILGSGWKVAASVGHVRDLPVREMGVAAPDFKPRYVPTDQGKEVLARLAGLAKNAEAVYLATDPDREGEAIAWHLAEALKLKNPPRVTYTEITEKAVLAAVAAPRSIDMALVAAQEGRRVLDRFCGYLVSGPLSNAIGAKSSAGRVQSPALRLFVGREAEIQDFKPTTHYGATLTFEAVDNISRGWKAAWATKPWLAEGQEYLKDKALAAKAAEIRTLDVADCQESESRSAPPAPFTTSSLQQTACKALKFPIKKIMELAQKLYEAGHITYIRTDSPNLSAEAVDAIRSFCELQSWPVVLTPRTWKAKGGAQEAHEAIRPTHIENEDAGETEDEKALYRLIRLRTLATQLEDAVYAVRLLTLTAQLDEKEVLFEAKGRVLLSPGWKILQSASDESEDAEQEAENIVPAMKPGSKATAVAGELTTKQTKAPARFTEASLVGQLEKMGIGRPATYVAIVNRIYDRGYAKQEKGNILPTPLGQQVIAALVGKFSFVDYGFTKEMEQALDDIASGKAQYKDVVSKAHDRLQAEVAAFAKATGKVCEKCGKPMRRRVKAPGKDGKGGYDFWGCTGWPECGKSVLK